MGMNCIVAWPQERQGGDSTGPRSLEELVRQQASSSSSRVSHSDGSNSNDTRSERRRSDRSIDMKGLEQAMRGLGLQKAGKNDVQGRGERGRGRNASLIPHGAPPGLVKECNSGEPEVAPSRVHDKKEEGTKESTSQRGQTKLVQGPEKCKATLIAEGRKKDVVDDAISCTESGIGDRKGGKSNSSQLNEENSP